MNNYKNILSWAAIFILLFMLFNTFNLSNKQNNLVPYSDFLNRVDANQVSKVRIEGQNLFVTSTDGQSFETYAPEDPNLVKGLLAKGVQMEAQPPKKSPWYISLLLSWFPMLLLIGVWIFFMRQMQGGGGGKGGAMSFGRSRAKLLNDENTRVTFKDVAGVDEAKEELSEIVDFLKDPQKFTRLGGRIPKGVLLVGSPGTGKTLLARAVAGEAGVPFYSISGSDFVEMFVGVGAARVRDLFTQGKKNAPCLIFIDEIDAVGRQRGSGMGGGNDEREQTLNQLLVEMDGFESNEGVILIAATNRPDVLDPALLRPGRFDRQVIVPNPDLVGREQILKVHTRKTPLETGVDLKVIARGTPGFSGADLENLVNEAALHAAKVGQNQIRMSDFEDAKDKVLMGKERRSLILSDEEKRNTAYHEGGHALVAKLLPGSDPIHKVTIIPRGRALGVTMQLPTDDRHSYSRDFLEKKLAMMLGGRAAEELVFNERTTGASNDIERATKTARNMVCNWGMSEKLGPLSYADNQEQTFLGRESGQSRNFSEETSRLIDAEIKYIMSTAYDLGMKLLKENRKYLDKIAEMLLERETLTGDEIDLILKGKKLPPMDDGDTPKTKKTKSASKDSDKYIPLEEQIEQTEDFVLEPSLEKSIEKARKKKAVSKKEAGETKDTKDIKDTEESKAKKPKTRAKKDETK